MHHIDLHSLASFSIGACHLPIRRRPFINLTIITVLFLSGGIRSTSPVWANSSVVLPSSGLKQSSDSTLPDLDPTGRPQDTGGGASHAVPDGRINDAIGGASDSTPDFRGTGRSGNHGGGASRGGCSATETDIPLTLLTPVEAGNGGLTIQSKPTLWAYVPFVLNENSPITFSLLDASDRPVYESFQAVDHEPGILKLELPDSITLEIGQVYEWYLIIHCNDPLGTREATFARGWVERVADPMLTQTGGTPSSDIALSDAYANRLIWYDALTILGESLLKNPNDPQLLNAWSDLLSLPSVQLDAVSTVPLRDCCTLQDESSEEPHPQPLERQQ
ncbi:MAG: DUF928 domain-containing protein [Merismopedia sp. SIO2A8]|nr:DUF928 domain-containing protein [Merismopedia sp. SIO2A8]